ncbi:MAG: PorV/PorQ family protein [Candidatus Fermentibacteraceae bacterium]|nr:PorV/PorQ family protein [Candidatus Fermentibacteraceae bacterium]
MIRRVLFLFAILSLTSVSFASTASVVWMTITPGARPNGMGEAFVALADDATASYWNPAGLAFVDSTRQELTLQHSNWLPQLADDLYYEFLGYAKYLEGWGGIGGNITFMSMGEQLETTSEGVELGTFYSYGVALTGSFGTEVAPGVSVGLGLKFIYDHLYYQDSGKGTSFAADLGVLYHIPMDDLGIGNIGRVNIAACLSNLGPNVSYGGNTDNNPLPRTIRAGLAYIPFDSHLTRLRVTADYSKLLTNVEDGIGTEFNENKWGTGAEFWYYDLLALRAGYIHDTEGISTIQGPTFGAGLQYSGFQLDMAFIPVEENLQGSGKYNSKYSLSVRF